MNDSCLASSSRTRSSWRLAQQSLPVQAQGGRSKPGILMFKFSYLLLFISGLGIRLPVSAGDGLMTPN